jgi:hypothetical protein
VDVGMAGIRKEFDNPNVNRTSIAAAMMLNISPYSPEQNVREIRWEYSCGGPGVFAGDLYYYYYDHNVTPEEASKIDTSKCMLYFLTGEYDPNTFDLCAASRKLPRRRNSTWCSWPTG